MQVSREIQTLPLHIDDTPALSLSAMRTRCRRLKRTNGLSLVGVDYLQLMAGPSNSENRQQEVSQISRGLKALAKELSVPVVALSQLSRAPEQRTGDNKRPQLSDLRESGSIEQDADMVMFVYREDYYLNMSQPEIPSHNSPPGVADKHAMWSEHFMRVEGQAELIIAKQRHGSTGKVMLKFEPHITKFSDLAPGHGYES